MSFVVSKYGASFTIPPITVAKATINTSSIATKALMEEGGQAWDLIFDSKPSFTSLPIPVTFKDLMLYYQPSLTEEFKQEECVLWTPTHIITKRGMECLHPVELVGGYAAYHRFLRDNEYKAGKLFNILAPKFIDKNGVIAYGSYGRDLMETGIFTIIPPAKFFDDAVYPVTVDPDFGKTNIGGSTDYDTTNYSHACKATAPASGNVTNISAYVSGPSGTVNMKAAFYPASAGGSLIGQSAAVAVTSSDAWWDFACAGAITNGVAYWLGVIASGNHRFYYDAGAASQFVAQWTITYPTFPDPWDAAAESYQDWIMSIHADYTPASATYTKTFTFDGLLLKSLTKTLSLDAWLKQTLTKTFTFDGLTKILGTKTFTLDGLLLKSLTKGLSFDGLLTKTLTKGLTFDGILLKTLTKDFSLDGLLSKSLTKDFSFDGLLLKGSTKDFSLDGLLLGVQVKAFSFDGVLETGGTKSFTFDGLLYLQQTKNFTFDGMLFLEGSKAFSFDSQLLKTQAQTFSMDGILYLPVKDFTFDGILESTVIPSAGGSRIILGPLRKRTRLNPRLLNALRIYLEWKTSVR